MLAALLCGFVLVMYIDRSIFNYLLTYMVVNLDVAEKCNYHSNV